MISHKLSLSYVVTITITFLFSTICATVTTYTQSAHPDLLSGLQTLRSVRETTSLIQCGVLCSGTPECARFLYRKNVCTFIDDQPIGKDPYVYQEGDLLYTTEGEVQVLGFRFSAGTNQRPFEILQGPTDSDNLSLAGDLSVPLPVVFKHPIMERWNDLTITKVRLVLRSEEKTNIVITFDATIGRVDKLTWMNKAHLISSPWTDLSRSAPTNFFGLTGSPDWRRFYMSATHTGCLNDLGWLVVLERIEGGWCIYERRHKLTDLPVILYSKTLTKINWLAYADTGMASDLMIWLVISV